MRALAALIIGLTAMLPAAAQEPQSRFADLEARARESLASDAGQKYLQTFYKQARVIRRCAPVDGRIVDPVAMYVEVKRGGVVGRIESESQTDTAICITRVFRRQVFASPPADVVFRIDVNLTPSVGDIFQSSPLARPRIPSHGQLDCDYLALGPSEWLEESRAPAGPEFSVYEVYLCSEAAPRFLVLWRFRNPQDARQLAGELVLPSATMARARHLDPGRRRTEYLFSFGRCSGPKHPHIDALFTNVRDGPAKQRLLVTWTVDTQNKRLVRVDRKEAAECSDEP